MVVAVVALVMSTTGGAIAAVNYARNSDAVDGYSAVKAKSSNKKAAGKLVATYPGGGERGKIPFRFLSGAASTSAVNAVADAAARGKNGATFMAVPDNGATTATTLIDLELGTLQVACFDEADNAGRENPATRISIANGSGAAINSSRRVGTAAPAIQTLDPSTVDTFDVGGQNTFSIQLHGADGKTVLVEGTARQAGQGTADGSCGVFATAVLVN
jgi:hypothetical protein